MNMTAIRLRLAVLVGGVGLLLVLTGPWLEDWNRVALGLAGLALAWFVIRPNERTKP